MPLNVLNKIKLDKPITNETDDIDIPIDISDIINICKEYSKLGWHIQNQVECITDLGIEEAISSGKVKVTALPHIKDFLYSVSNNMYFGDAAEQAQDCIALIENFENKNPDLFKASPN